MLPRSTTRALRPRLASTGALVTLAAVAAACTTRATQVEVEVATDTPPERAFTLRATVRAVDGDGSVGEPRAFTYGGPDSGARAPFAGSFGVTPGTGPRDARVEVRLEATIGATATAPEQRITRRMRFRFEPRVPQRVRAFLPVACANASTGCTSVPDAMCTVSVRCEEQDQTCGDDGRCRSPDVPFVPPDAGWELVDAAPDGAAGDAPEPPAPPPVTLVAPLSTAHLTATRPTLRWHLPAGTDSGQVQICHDRALSGGCPVFVVSGESLRPPVSLPPGAYFWQVRAVRAGIATPSVSPVWEFFVGSRAAPVDATDRAVVDLNGDGLADVLVGAGSASPGGRAQAGEARVHFGTPGGPSAAPVVLEGPVGGEKFGWVVASVGDVNGDGFAELGVGVLAAAPGGHALAGEVRIFLGDTRGPSRSPAYVLPGMADGEGACQVAGAGDVNGDGYADVIVGAPGASPGGRANAGAIRVYLGSAAGLSAMPSATLVGFVAGDQFGWDVAGAGDVDGDGYGDVLVGAAGASPGGRTGAGAVYLFRGSASGLQASPAAFLQGDAAGDGFANARGAGDVNGDGLADVLVGAARASPGGLAEAGEVKLFLGAAGGIATTPAAVITGRAAGDHLGFWCDGAGDVNGDGFGDVIVGSPTASPAGRTAAGEARVLYGGAATGVLSAAFGFPGQAAGDHFGDAVGGPGDVDGDHFDDLIVSAPEASPGGRTGAGVVSFFRGGAAPPMLPGATFEGDAAGDHFGAWVALAPRGA